MRTARKKKGVNPLLEGARKAASAEFGRGRALDRMPAEVREAVLESVRTLIDEKGSASNLARFFMENGHPEVTLDIIRKERSRMEQEIARAK